MPPGSDPDGQRCRLGQRILAMGYTEAKMRTNLQSRLDVLTETTAAYCDVFCPDPAPGSFFVANVDVLQHGVVASTTIADFDLETKEPMSQGDGLVLVLGSAWHVKLPGTLPAAARGPLEAWWKEDAYALVSGYNPPAIKPLENQPVDAEAAREFHESLRHAFDAIAKVDAYTLRVDVVVPQDGVSGTTKRLPRLALGYCLASNRAVEVQKVLGSLKEKPHSDSESKKNKIARERFNEALTAIDVLVDQENGPPSRLAVLEALQIPEDAKVLRNQSDNNVATRTASLVRNPKFRSLKIKRTAGISEAVKIVGPGGGWDLLRNAWAELETVVWPGGWPPKIFVMPLTNHEFIPDDACPETIAFWYVAIPARETLDIEALLASHYRAASTFSERLCQRYCQALADAMARRIARGDTGASVLNPDCKQVALAYRLPAWLTFNEKLSESDSGLPPSVYDRLGNLRDAGLIADAPWGPTTDGLLREVFPKVTRGRERHETEVLLRLCRSLVLASESTVGGNRKAAYESLGKNLEELRGVLTQSRLLHDDAEKRIVDISRDIGFPRARWTRLRTLGRFFGSAQTTPPCSAPPPPSEALAKGSPWRMYLAHDRCGKTGCTPCDEETNRRIAYLLGVEVTETAVTSPTILARAPSGPSFPNDAPAWEWLKRASEKDRPTVASIVVLLWMEGVKVNVLSGDPTVKPEDALKLADVDWTQSLAGVAALSTVTPKFSSEVPALELNLTKDSLTFKASGLSYEKWFVEKVQKKLVARCPRAGTSRQRAAAAALGLSHAQWNQPVPTLCNGPFKLCVCDGALICTWSLQQ